MVPTDQFISKTLKPNNNSTISTKQSRIIKLQQRTLKSHEHLSTRKHQNEEELKTKRSMANCRERQRTEVILTKICNNKKLNENWITQF